MAGLARKHLRVLFREWMRTSDGEYRAALHRVLAQNWPGLLGLRAWLLGGAFYGLLCCFVWNLLRGLAFPDALSDAFSGLAIGIIVAPALCYLTNLVSLASVGLVGACWLAPPLVFVFTLEFLLAAIAAGLKLAGRTWAMTRRPHDLLLACENFSRRISDYVGEKWLRAAPLVLGPLGVLAGLGFGFLFQEQLQNSSTLGTSAQFLRNGIII